MTRPCLFHGPINAKVKYCQVGNFVKIEWAGTLDSKGFALKATREVLILESFDKNCCCCCSSLLLRRLRPGAPASFFALLQHRHARLVTRTQGEHMRSPTDPQTDKTQPAENKTKDREESGLFRTFFLLRKKKKKFRLFLKFLPIHFSDLFTSLTPLLPLNLLCVTSCMVNDRKWIFGHTFPAGIPASNERAACAHSGAAPVKVAATKIAFSTFCVLICEPHVKKAERRTCTSRRLNTTGRRERRTKMKTKMTT